MKKLILGILLSTVMLTGAAFAKGGGGGVPSPFVESSNRRVELADGEMYTLQGKVVFDSNDVAFFWVDLEKHPWLANAHRQQNPYYRLIGSKDQWREYNEKSIQLICIARGVTTADGYEIQLSAVTDAGPTAVTRRKF
jgi:hypothetical protein